MAGRRVMSEDLKNVEFETSEDVDVTPTFDNRPYIHVDTNIYNK
jgi:hypothetical protein